MVRVDTYTMLDKYPEREKVEGPVSAKADFLRSFGSLDEAVAFLRPLSLIPGNHVALIMYIDGRPVEIMVF